MKGNHQPNESITFGMGENINKCYQQGFNFQNIHKDHTTQYKKKKKTNQKMDRRPHGLQNQAPPSMGFSRQEYWSRVPLPSPQGRHTDGQLACKMILNIVNY